MKTLIYTTDNSLPEPLATRCRELLVREAKGIPIVSVSQEPVDLGLNVCVGKIGRSWLNLYKQLMAGLEQVKTKYVGICEHDCIYSNEHLAWLPTKDDTFFYNHHFWLVQWGGNHPELEGMYSYWRNRYALSQLVCSAELLKKSLSERLALLQDGYVLAKGMHGAGEFGVKDKIAMIRKIASSGSPEQLQKYDPGLLTEYKSESFMTKIPNLDVRHKSNFTGTKRGNRRRFELPYWGKFAEVCHR
jgi:hypothetical protein